MFISPSKILYCNCLEMGALNDVSPDKDIMDVSDTLRRGARYPKLQVVRKDGFYFTLNDTKLKLYRHMEAIGQCGMVKVEKVPIREVPEGIRTLMKVPENVLKKSNSGKGFPLHLKLAMTIGCPMHVYIVGFSLLLYDFLIILLDFSALVFVAFFVFFPESKNRCFYKYYSIVSTD